MPATPFYAAKAALLTLMDAWDWPGTDPTVTWGERLPSGDQAFQCVYMGDVRVEVRKIVLGEPRHDEEFTLPIVIDVFQWGDDEQATEQRAWALYDSLISLLRANSTLAGTVHRWNDIRVTPSNTPGPQQWRTLISVEVECVGYTTYV